MRKKSADRSGKSTPRRRRVGVLDGDYQGTVLTQSVPPLRKGEIMIQVKASLISPGTQLGDVRARRAGKEALRGAPRLCGYQNAGRVAAVASNVTQFAPGERVAAMGPGALHATYAVVPQNLCTRLPAGIGYDHASGMNLVLTAVQCLRRAEAQFGENMLVVGMGLVGQLCAQVGRAAGLRVMAWDTLRPRLAIAKRAGAEAMVQVGSEDPGPPAMEFTDGLGFDIAVLAFGGDGTPALNQVVDVMKITPDGHRMGRIMLVGGVKTSSVWGAGLGNLDLRSAARTGPGYHDNDWEHGRSEYPPVFVRWTTRSNMDMALRWMTEGKLKMEPLITHRMPLSEFRQAVDMFALRPQKALGVVLNP